MNIFLWVLQILLALHTAVGALWKFSNSAEQTMPSLSAIPQSAWLALAVFELICAACLIFPALSKRFTKLIPLAAIGIALEMLLFIGLHLKSGDSSYGSLIYWGIVAGICAFVAYGRLVLKRL